MSNRYRTIRIPANLVDSIHRIMERHKDLGYRSHSEFIIDAVRRRVESFLTSDDKKKKK